MSCVLSTLLYGSVYWRIAEHDLAKLLSFHTSRPRKIRLVFWPRIIFNREHLASCQYENNKTFTTRKRWRWLGYVLRKGANSITKVASIGPQRDNGRVVDQRKPGEELWKQK